MTAGQGVLSGVHVRELTLQLSGPHSGVLLADMGADVIKIEPPELPDPARAAPSV